MPPVDEPWANGGSARARTRTPVGKHAWSTAVVEWRFYASGCRSDWRFRKLGTTGALGYALDTSRRLASPSPVRWNRGCSAPQRRKDPVNTASSHFDDRPQALGRAACRRGREFERRTNRHVRFESKRQPLPLGVPMSGCSVFTELHRSTSTGNGACFTDVTATITSISICAISDDDWIRQRSRRRCTRSQARRGAQYLLRLRCDRGRQNLSDRTGLPYWQFTLSASAPYRSHPHRPIMTNGHESLSGAITTAHRRDPGSRGCEVRSDTDGLSPRSGSHTAIVPFNDCSTRTHAPPAMCAGADRTVLTNCQPRHAGPDFHAA